MSDRKLLSKYFPRNKILLTFVGNDGSVYILDNKVAVKILHKSKWSKPENIENEAIVQQLAYLLGLSPEVYFFNADEGIMFSEYIDGITLDEYINRHPDKIADIKTKIKKVLDILYDNGIVHNDLDGTNFLIQNNGEIKIIDFSTGKLKSGSVPVSQRRYFITGQMEHYFGSRAPRN